MFVHPLAVCESASVGAGTRIWAFAHVLDGAVIGRECNIGDHAFIETGAVIGDRVTIKNAALIWDGVTIEDDVFIGPRVTFTNDMLPRTRSLQARSDWLVPTAIRRGATLGAGVTVVCGVVVGAFSFVGAGSLVTRHIVDHAFVLGSPARQVGWACLCGAKLEVDGSECSACGRSYLLAADSGPRFAVDDSD